MSRRSGNVRQFCRLTAGLLAGTCLSSKAWAANFDVTNETQLRSAITSAGNGDTITFRASITLTADLPAVQTNVTIVGGGNTLSGNNQFRGLFIGAFSGSAQVPVTVAVQDLTIANTKASGGAGGGRGGGGGAGVGGAIFVAGQANVTVSNVSLTSNAANGGVGALSTAPSVNGGGGGMGGNGGASPSAGGRGGGGGLGVGANGGDSAASGSAGIATGAASGGAGAGNPGSGGGSGGGGGGGIDSNSGGGGGGVGGGASGGVLGGAGGFGGGGGGGAGINAGGTGGFGGGGGGGTPGGAGGFGGGGGGGSSGSGAVGGFGGGSGNNTGNSAGGGGAGMGGAIFVQQGGSLTLSGPLSVNGNSVAGGTGGDNGATNGSAFGSGIFIQGNNTITFSPASGTQTVSDVIADQTGSGGSGGTAGTGNVAKSGAGTVVLSAANTYTGTTTVTGGLINFAAANNLGSGTITLNGGGLQWATGNTTDISSRLAALGAGGGTFDTNGNNVSFATALSGGGLTKGGTGTLTLSGSNTYSGATTITGGTLALASGASVASSSGVTVASGATFDTSANVGFTSIQSLAGGGTVQLGGGLFLSNASGNFSGSITGGGGLEVGAGTQTLSGVNGYTNTTQIDGGATLALSGNGSIASSVSATLAGAGATFDISQTNAGATVNALVGVAGSVVSLGGKTLTISGSGSFFSGVIQDGGIGGGTGGTLAISGGATQDLRGVNTYTGATTIAANSTLTLTNNGSIASSSGVNLTGAFATFDISNATSDRTIQGLSGVTGSSVLLGNNNLIVGSSSSTTFAGVMDGSGGTGGLIKQGSGTLTLSGTNTYTGGTTINAGLINFNALSNFGTGNITLNGGGLQWATGNTIDPSSRLALGAGGGTFDTNGNNVTLSGNFGGTGAVTKAGAGVLTLTGNNSYAGGTTITGGLINFASTGNLGTGQITMNGGGLQWATGNTTDISSKLAPLGSGGGTFDTNGNNVTLASAITGSGGLTKAGLGTLILSGNNTYSGGTTVSAGTLVGNTSSLQGNITNNAAVMFTQTGSGTYAGNMSGTGSLALQGGGTYALTGNSTFTGPTTVTGSKIVVNGSMTSAVTLDAASTIGGSGSIGGLTSNGATLTPGNSIGTLTVNGTFSSTGGTYVVEANAQGQSDKINVNGAATINGGAVQVVAAAGNYATSTTYTIFTATGGLSGTYSGVSSNFAFLTPSLSYNANNVFLTLALQGNAFSGFGGNTVNQRNVGYALDQSFASATGDFATVIGALATLNTQQGPYALNQISGQPYADFGTFNVANNALFMNALGQQMAVARGAAAGSNNQRQALAEACEVEACDGVSPFSVWGSVLGGVGSAQGDGNSQTFTYNVGGAAAGVDYRVSPNLLLGIGTGYTNGTQWVDSFQGKGWSNSVSVAAYGSFTQWGAYLDALAGYAYSNNQLQRQISIPGLQPRTANGSTGANQFLGQAEIGYQVPVYAPAQATVTPFARLQVMSVNQAAFNEWGANSLSLNVQQQTTNSLRSTLGAQLDGAIGFGDAHTLNLALRLGWLHEYAYTGRPITAAFAGAPAANFTVYGATPQRDAAAIGFQASTNVAAATQVFFRYDGDIGSGTDNHAVNLGLRFSW